MYGYAGCILCGPCDEACTHIWWYGISKYSEFVFFDQVFCQRTPYQKVL